MNRDVLVISSVIARSISEWDIVIFVVIERPWCGTLVRHLGQPPWSANEDECDWLGIGILTGLFKRKSEYRFSAVVCLFYQRVGRSIE